ncbi:SAM-dependent methyltransferase [Nocardia sp. CDC159]|uniref:SAM-dependent methyltransferase n=1 Tax=Nocardia pulmonis TaxID=2951408 RepID=A0A9X2E4Y6_9NOCA|nr:MULTISPECIES: SAM-dependent methyltransferase [Nocardia]MCM6773720.1 SAM-dependent methyltransferase [Nocardia pulmonis]MCM6786607.1 SAM-dependent methyltransferase [Nocardia sp. CDC159]
MSRPPMGFDPHNPTSARVLNYLQGGKDGFTADKDLGEQILSVAPDTMAMVWFSRQFLIGAVRMAAEAGIRQFVDLGAGMPMEPTVHETARSIHPDARVVYVDYDPVVFAHCNALYAGTPGVGALLGDVRRPGEILDELRDQSLIDPREPVAMLLIGVLPFVHDEDDPTAAAARIRDWMAPGSYFAVTHSSSTSDPKFVEQVLAATKLTAAEITFRSPEQISAFFDGFDLLKPGLVPIQQWLAPDLPETGLVTYGAIGRKPGAVD